MRALFFAFLLGCTEYEFIGKEATAPGETAVPDPPGDCDLEAPETSVSPDESCLVTVDPGGFSPVVEWQWSENPVYAGYHQIMATPAVANLSDDNGDGLIDENDVPDVVFASFSGAAYSTAGTLTAISGDGTGTLWSVYDPGGAYLYSSSQVAIGDLDGDGVPEVCASGYLAGVVCLSNTGELLWQAGAETYPYGGPSLADLDGDGSSEVIFGRTALNADGSVRWQASGGVGRYLSFAIDMDGDGQLEVSAGSSLYDTDGTLLWDDGTADGPSAVGDFDGDGLPELVHVGSGVVYLVGADGVVRWSAAVPGGGSGGAPTVADFDGDGAPEIGVAGAYQYAVLDSDGSTLWTADVQDWSSNVTGSSVFDFEGDGNADVVYADELALWVYDGATGAVKLHDESHASGTLYEYPLIVDVDGDGVTEIVLASNNYTYSGWNGITVIGDATGTWRPSRPIWNQFAYHITNVEDDGGIPAVQEANWTRWNSFRAAASSLGRTSDLANLAPTEPDLCTETCGEGTVDLLIPVQNSGLYDVPAVTVSLRRGESELRTDTVSLASGEVVWIGPVTLTEAMWGGGIAVRVDPEGAVDECDEDDNVLPLGAWPCD